MDAYRSELDAAENRLALLNDAIAERERRLGLADRASSTRTPARRRRVVAVASLTFFVVVTAVAAVSFASARVSRLEVSHAFTRMLPVASSAATDEELPLIAKLREKVALGTATEEEREALDELSSLYQQNRHLRRSFVAMTRLADGRLEPGDRLELDRFCYLGGHRRCLALVRGAADTR